jgi:glycyl-tRNA synthetase
VTIDFQTLADETVTVRERDSKKQERVSIDRLKDYLNQKLLI